MRCRVVSLPATSSDMLKVTSSAGERRWPSTSDPTSSDTTSSAGLASLSAASCSRKATSSMTSWSASGGSAARPSEARIVASDQRRKSPRFESGTPSRSQMTRTGRGAASTSTRSTTSPGGIASSRRTASSRISCSIRSTARAVNSRLRVRRHAPCSGGSMCRIDPAMAPPSRSGSFTSAPRPEQNASGLRLMSRMSRYRVTALIPGAYSNTGASTRSRASRS